MILFVHHGPWQNKRSKTGIVFKKGHVPYVGQKSFEQGSIRVIAPNTAPQDSGRDHNSGQVSDTSSLQQPARMSQDELESLF